MVFFCDRFFYTIPFFLLLQRKLIPVNMTYFGDDTVENATKYALLIVSQYQISQLEVDNAKISGEMKYALKPFNESFLQNIIDFYTEKDQLLYPGSESLILNLSPVLLGPDPNHDFNVPTRLTTEDILEVVHTDDKVHPFTSPALAQELVKILAASIKLLNSPQPETKAVIFEFMTTLPDLFPQFITGATLPSQVNVVIEYLRQHKTSSVISQLYPLFKNIFTTQINLLVGNSTNIENSSSTVLKLREQGNNLMLNLGYSQAIQLYTTAINLCTFHDTKNIPQLLTNRAIAYIGLDSYPEARSDLNQAVKLDRCFTPAWTQLGYCHLYMGSCLTGLRCYLAALESLVGDILPPNIPTSLVEEYKQNKIDSVLPQFVQRIIQAMILTERRCYQECEEGRTIKSIDGNARRILAKLRANASSEDLSLYAYLYDYNDGSFRSSATLSNRAEPNILTHEVGQDIIGSGQFETTALAISATNPLDEALDRVRAGRNGDTRIVAIGGGRPNATTSVSGNNGNPSNETTDTGAAPPNVRNLLNDFGEIFEGTLAAQAGLANDNGSTPTTVPNTGTEQNDAFRNIRNMLPEGFGGMVSQVLGSLGDAVNGAAVRQYDLSTGNSTSHRTSHSTTANGNSNGNGNNQRPEGDIDMADPDLD